MRETTIGIDLGTTFSCVATINEYGKPIVLKNEDGNSITPSVVAFEQDGSVIVGDEAKNIQSLGDADVASFFKREMGNPNFYFTFHDKQYSPTDLSAFVLANLKASAEKAIGKTVTKAVITCPANFNALQREEVKKAGKDAGLDVLRVINEPTAAAIAFGIQSEKEQTLLVYDLGGGTFDVTLMKITADEIDVLATAGNHQLGGKDWDDMLREYAVSKFQEEFADNPLEDFATANDLLVAAENVKKALSQKATANFVIAYNGNKGQYAITREQFEDTTEHLINQTLTLCESVLAAKQIDWKNIDGILLVGGSTRMPQVKSELKEYTDKPILHGINVDEAVAIGAATQADLDANEKQYTLKGRRTIKEVQKQSHEKRIEPNVPTVNTKTDPPSNSLNVSYSPWAGISRVQTSSLDKFGNAKGDEFDLVKDGSFDTEKIYVLDLSGGRTHMKEPEKSLIRKGFHIIEVTRAPDARTLRVILKDTSQFWLISGGAPHGGPPLENAHIDVIQDYFEEGHGLYLWGDNDPFFHHANQITQVLFDTTMSGDSPGGRVVSLFEEQSRSGVIKNHLISTGIVNIYEGITIAEVHTNKFLQPLIYGSNGKVLAAYYDQNGKRAIIDGGFTRLSSNWNSAGTDRYIVNAAVWLANIERFPRETNREQILKQ